MRIHLKSTRTLQFIYKPIIIILLFTIVMQFNITAQTDVKIESANLALLDEKLTEKVHLHFDRTLFSPGEDIWFKAYLLEGTFHTLASTTSSNLHVDLISPEGAILKSLVVFMNNGVGHGDFKLDGDDYTEGMYQIRAYTNFMRNFNSEIFYKQNILIKCTLKEKERTNSNPEIDLHFFPEGGVLVQNILNRVAFKVADQHGNGTSATINIFDDQNNKIQTTSSVHNGMGYFHIIPEINVNYYAIVNSDGLASKKVELPKSTEGYSILVGNQFHNILDFNICTSPNNVNGQKVSYLIQSRGKLFSSGEIKMNTEKELVRIEKTELPEGISSITIYNETGIPVCERLVYNQLYQKINIKIQKDKNNYHTRDKIVLDIQTTDEKGKPISANLSLSVVEQALLNLQKKKVTSPGILSSILLCTDLKGTITDPDFYFKDFDRKKHFLLDLVLLTHGWRKYVWKDMVTQESLSFDFANEHGFSFSGTVKNGLFNTPTPNSKVTLTIVDDGLSFHELKSDENGKFKFENIFLRDTASMIFQAYDKRDKRKTKIELDSSNYQLPKTKPINQQAVFQENNYFAEFTKQSEIIRNLEDSLNAKNNKIIEEVTVIAKKILPKSHLVEDDNHSRIYTKANQTIKVDEVLSSYPDIFGIIRGRVPGAQVVGACPEIKVIMRNYGEAKILLNGMFVDTNTICSLSSFNVDKIEILKGANASIFGARGLGGVIAIYTKTGEEQEEFNYIPVGIEKIKANGYYRSREFYAPQYDKPQDKFTGIDLRNTLYWSPNITTNSEGKAQISFFNSDKESEYNIKVEGVGLLGGIGERSAKYKVVARDQ